MSVLDSQDLEGLDGRLARSRRTRRAIVEGLIALLEEGSVHPTVEDIAARAGVAPRTVFQHYADREALFAAVSEHRQGRLDHLMGRLPDDGPLEARIDAVVAQRLRVYEWIAPVRRAALLMEPFSESARAALEGLRAVKRAEAVRVFTHELRPLPGSERAALEAAIGAAASWATWDALRAQQGLDAEAAARALRQLLRGLVSR